MSAPLDLIGLGELLWDCFPDRRLPGGAPANVAYHGQQLGLRTAVATRVGDDSLGNDLQQFLVNQHLRVDLLQRDPQHGTGTVTVEPKGLETTYTFLENSAWDFLEADEVWLNAFSQTRAVCFGTLAQRQPVSRATIHKCVTATLPGCLRVYDINLRPPFFDRAWIEASLLLANVVKLNDAEVRTIAELWGQTYRGDEAFCRRLLQEFDLQLVCVTRGAQGAIAVAPSEVVEVAGLPVHVADTVGAGDAFTAAMIWALLAQRPLPQALQLANGVGALVASRPGAMPDVVKDYAALIAEILP